MNPGLIGYLIGLAFAVFWLRIGAAAVGGPEGTAILIVGSVLLVAALWRIWQNRYRRTEGARFRLAWYLLAVGGEVVAMNAAVLALPKPFLDAYQWPVIGTIVGLHFVGLWAATRMRRFLYLSVAMTAINLAAFALPPGSGPGMLAGLGSAAALAITVAA